MHCASDTPRSTPFLVATCHVGLYSALGNRESLLCSPYVITNSWQEYFRKYTADSPFRNTVIDREPAILS